MIGRYYVYFYDNGTKIYLGVSNATGGAMTTTDVALATRFIWSGLHGTVIDTATNRVLAIRASADGTSFSTTKVADGTDYLYLQFEKVATDANS